MRTEELRKLILQHGEAARSYQHEAVQIGETYIIQNFGFDMPMQIALEELLKHRRSEEYGLVDVRIFAISEDFSILSDKEITEVAEDENAAIHDLVQLCQELYPNDYPHYSLPEWWTEEDMQNASQVMDSLDFALEVQKAFRLQEGEEDTLNTWLKAIRPWLGEEITLYYLEDINDGNCAFYPFIFVGARCLILAAWKMGL